MQKCWFMWVGIESFRKYVTCDRVGDEAWMSWENLNY